MATLLKHWRTIAAAVAIIAAAVSAWGWREEIGRTAEAIEEARTLQASLSATNEEAERLADEVEAREAIVESMEDERHELETKLDSARDKIEKGANDESEPYHECRGVDLPDDLRDGLRDQSGAGGRD